MDKICRVCISESGEMHQIFNSETQDEISEMIMFCTGLKLTKEDFKPKQICEICLTDLETAHHFKTNALKSDTKLEEYKETIKKEEIVYSDDDGGLIEYNDFEDFFNDVKEEVHEKPVVVEEPKEIEKVKKKSAKKVPRKVGDTIIRQYKCGICDKKFPTMIMLHKHKSSHNPDSWICEICGRVFTNRSAHFSHMRVHQQPQYKCDQCNYVTAYKYDLVKHLYAHSGYKPYQCDKCSASYCTISGLHAHDRRTHQKSKPHACPICDKRFFARSKMMYHIDSHNNVKRHACTVCESQFTRRCHWKKHLMKQHGVTVPPVRFGRKRNDELLADKSEP